jgi:hypothetical protein
MPPTGDVACRGLFVFSGSECDHGILNTLLTLVALKVLLVVVTSGTTRASLGVEAGQLNRLAPPAAR